MRLGFYIVLFHSLVSLCVQAQNLNGSELHIKLTDPSMPFIVSIDQRLYYNPDGYFSMGNLNGGKHDFKLYRYIPFTLQRVDSTLLICEGTLFIAPASRMLLVLDPTKRFFISEVYNPLQYSMNSNLYNSVYSKYFPMVPYNCLDSNSYQGMITQLKDMPFNDLKITLIKESFFFNGINTAQLKELMLMFPFDKDRLDLAVFAYGNCNDKQNFNTINETFTFKQSERDLKNKLIFYYNYGSTYLIK